VPGRRALYLREILSRIWKFLLLFVGVWVVAAILFYFLDGKPGVTPFNAFYWSIVTISTLGYGDIVPETVAAKLVTIGTLFVQIFLLGYLISVITTTVNEESQRRALGTLGTDMKNHIIVLGFSDVGRAAVRELLLQEQTVAVVTEQADQVAHVRTLGPEHRLFVTYGPPADRDILRRVNITDAHSVVVCTHDDAANMIAALNIRALAPHVRIVVSVSRPELRETLRSTGVTYVASPADMGGRLCAEAAFEPDVAIAMEDITAADVKADMQEYLLRDTTPISRQTVGEAEQLVRSSTGCLLVGFARPGAEGEFDTTVNPPADARLQPGDAILVLGTIANTTRFRHWFGVDQGR
jgi:voltage-gated potassium channel Kch